MLYFLGNCQADFLSRAMTDKGYDCTYRVLASPLTYPSSPGVIPTPLAAMDEQLDLEPYFHGRTLQHQFQPIGPNDETPELIVLSLFHENTPLFIHNDDGAVFFMDPRALTDKPALMEWTQTNCRMFKPNPATYLKRYGDMLARMRAGFPDVPIMVLSRLSHYPAFGPDPFSYLEGWDELWRGGMEILEGWASTLDNVRILNMDRVFGGIWEGSDKRIESHCPFLKIKLEEKDGEVVGLHAQRDIEHIGPMPDRLAGKVDHFLKSGTMEYDEDESVRPEWRRQWRIAKLDDGIILEKLASGANYLGAEAVASFFLDLERDYTEFLVKARERMPVCHMTLHMIKAYSRIHRNPELAVWCDAHRKAARQFTANGPLYQEAYIKRVEGMKRHVLKQG
ncbi:SGNH/GDSL hydrolase family protein [Pseudodesulfovibrio sp.]|nr:SGNH/GDSL hydrolase family protein [Pseudodesulfovibrio sp.]